ncbi:MAG: OmpA family protein [Moritella sp.]|uniref:OmpA family protein n=1 Tax=Moritella sp. TaxID=78556 RepID=UPI002173823E|nr:OmpA family protein [Moritella sp.]MBL1417780.1 OmpA family protein [Moritella sp.]
MSLKVLLPAFGSLFFCSILNAQPFISELDQVQWQLSSSSFECKMTTNVETLGTVSIVKKAGYPEFIDVTSTIYTQKIKRYRLGSSKAPWGVKILPDARWLGPALPLENEISVGVASFTRQLQQGDWGHIALTYVDSDYIHAVLPSVNLGDVFDGYYQCLRDISPFSYEQVRDRNLYYSGGSYLLNTQQKQEMAAIVKYISLDGLVTKVLIDGHSNSIGNTVNNLLLSQQRADDVYMYLMEAGISTKLMEVRSHGDRYPLKSDRTASGREKNRRVNLRIIRRMGK